MVIYETKPFTRAFDKLVGKAARKELYQYMEINPKSGDVIPGSGGIRKLRWSRPGMGKRGGVRVVYYYFDARGLVSLLTVYAKNQKDDMGQQEIKVFRTIVEQIRKEINGDNNG